MNLDIRQGESVAIVGTSGAGKSTLMTLLAGLDTPTSGEVHLLGKSLTELDDEAKAAIHQSVGWVCVPKVLLIQTGSIRKCHSAVFVKGEAEDKQGLKRY